MGFGLGLALALGLGLGLERVDHREDGLVRVEALLVRARARARVRVTKAVFGWARSS